MAAATSSSDGEAAALEASLEENRALRAEHEALVAETQQLCLALENADVPSQNMASAHMDTVCHSNLESLRREQQMLMGISRLGGELEDLRDVNSKLQDEASTLRAQNAKLASDNAALRDRTQNATPPTAAVRPAPMPAPVASVSAPPPKALVQVPVAESGVCLDAQVLPPGLAKRADEISTAIKLGRPVACSEEQRRELVAAMLKVSLTTTSPQLDEDGYLAPAVVAPSAATTANKRLPPAQPQNVAITQPQPVVPYAAPTPQTTKPAMTYAAPAPVEVQKGAPAVVTTPTVASAPPPAAAQKIPASNTAASSKAPVPAHAAAARVSPPVSSSGSALERRAQEIAEELRKGNSRALSSCSEEERKELVAEMLRQGVFMSSTSSVAPIPTTISCGLAVGDIAEPTALQESSLRGALHNLSSSAPGDTVSKKTELLSEVEIPEGMDDENFRERFIREKLQEMTTQQSG